MDKDLKRAIQEADKYVRWKKYKCLLPGCEEEAILSHAIPRASIVEALADSGIVYSLRQSYNSVMRMVSTDHPMEIVGVGVNFASTFKGFCAKHDAYLFSPAENRGPRKRAMFISMHLRALALEYCRKRRNVDYFQRLSEISQDQRAREFCLDIADKNELFRSAFGELYLGSIFNLMKGSPVDQIEWLCIPFGRNLMVSCCGVFPEDFNAIDSNVSYNLICYADMSILVLTIFKVVAKYLDTFLAMYPSPVHGERLINDIAFSKGEEPLIAARLWRALTEEQKNQIQLSLRPPHLRPSLDAPLIIKVTPDDFASQVTPEQAARLPPQMFGKFV